MKKLFAITIMALAVFSAQSCLYEQEDLFEESSSVRTTKLMEKARKALVASEQGWLMELYPEGSQKYGGFAFILKFDTDQKVTVYSELDEGSSTGYFNVSAEDGPVLIFDTYNVFMHYFATPNSSRYQAYEGEVEYVICDVSDNLIKLRGCKTGNIMYLRKFEGDPADYLARVLSEEDNIIMSGFEGSLGGVDIKASIDINYRQLDLAAGEETFSSAFTIIPDGIRLYKPIVVGDVEISTLAITSEGKISILEGSAAGTEFKTVYPEGFRLYDAFAGKYEFTFSLGTFPVELVPAGDGKSYIMKGICGINSDGEYNPDEAPYDLLLTYNKAQGNLHMTIQQLKKGDELVQYNGKYVGITPCASTKVGGTSGYLTFLDGAGMMTKWNCDEENPEYEFVSNGVYSRPIDTFWLCLYSGPTQTSDTRTSGSSLPVDYKFFGKTHLMYKPESLKKVNE
ncbi:MAG: DUF4302 domain-containing protein [Candidatus Cryptobacteroides sp.]